VKIPELNLQKELQRFDWKKLAKVRGAAHDAIVGAWIDWWINIDVNKHMVLNPPHKVDGKMADIMFLRRDEEYFYDPIGVAEVENNPEKWMEKIETLKDYWKIYSSQKRMLFLLLCVTTNPQYEERFEELMEHIKAISKTMEITWVLYRLDVGGWKNDIHAIVREDEMVWFYNYIMKGKAYMIKNGKIS